MTMFTGEVDQISNRATWKSKVCDLVDEDTLATTDLSTAGVVDIVVMISRLDQCGVLAIASIANGKVTIPGPGFQWQFEVADLANLCPGTYRLDAKVAVNGFVNDVIDGTIAVIEGN